MHSDSASDFISVTIKSVITHQMIDTLLYALKAKFLDVRLCHTVITDNESSASLSRLGKVNLGCTYRALKASLLCQD